jgi:hypothetical protein
MTDEPTRGKPGWVFAALAAGTAFTAVALVAALGVAAVALDAWTDSPDGCMGAAVLPMLTLAASAAGGAVGIGVTTVAGFHLWRHQS